MLSSTAAGYWTDHEPHRKRHLRNDNNFLMIISPRPAANYQQGSGDVQDRFADSPHADTPNPQVIVNGVTISSAFRPTTVWPAG
jgi:hypothetical protein